MTPCSDVEDRNVFPALFAQNVERVLDVHRRQVVATRVQAEEDFLQGNHDALQFKMLLLFGGQCHAVFNSPEASMMLSHYMPCPKGYSVLWEIAWGIDSTGIPFRRFPA